MLAPPNLSREFRLATACCRWPPSESRDTGIRTAAKDPVDWNLLLRIVERQRIAGLVYGGLVRAGVSLPTEAAAKLALNATAIARNSMALASEAIRLQALFDATGIAALFLKGTSLAVLAYGNIAIKHAWDIDLLVPRDAVRQACDVLCRAGYGRVSPPTSFGDERFLAWTEFAHESIFRHKTLDFAVELHWRLAENPNHLPEAMVAPDVRKIEISPGHALKTLGDEDLFSYLCLHGAHHGWSRLKWLSDLTAWLAAKPVEEVERLYRSAKSRGAGRAPDQALLLSQQLFGLALPAELAKRMADDRVTRWLVAIALNAMAGEGETQQMEDRKLGNLGVELSQFLLADSPRGWLQALRSKSVGWTDYLNLPLPRPLFFLYPMLRAPSWAWRRVSHLARRAAPARRASGS